MNVDAKITYIKEQTKVLQGIKKQLELSRSNAKEEIAKALHSFGIDKLEGVSVSSITVIPESQTSKTHIDITDEDALIRAGYFSVIVDKEAVEKALYSADQNQTAFRYCDDLASNTVATYAMPRGVAVLALFF